MKKKAMKSKVKGNAGRYVADHSGMSCKYEEVPMGGYRSLSGPLSAELTAPDKIYTPMVNESRQIKDSTGADPSNVSSKPKSFSKED